MRHRINSRNLRSRRCNSDADERDLINHALENDGSLIHLPNYSSRYRIKFEFGVGAGNWLMAESIMSPRDWEWRFEDRDPVNVEASMFRYVDSNGRHYDRNSEGSSNAYYVIRDWETDKIIADAHSGKEVLRANSRRCNSSKQYRLGDSSLVLVGELFEDDGGEFIMEYYPIPTNRVDSRVNEIRNGGYDTKFIKLLTFPNTKEGATKLFNELVRTGYLDDSEDTVQDLIETFENSPIDPASDHKPFDSYTQNSRKHNSNGYRNEDPNLVIVAEVWRDDHGESIEDYYTRYPDQVESRLRELREYKSKPDEMDFVKVLTFPNTKDGVRSLMDALVMYGNAQPGESLDALEGNILDTPLELNSRRKS